MIRQLEIIGEAVKRLSPALTAAEAAVPWRQIAGTRDRLIHGYFTVDLDAVWSMVEQDLPALRAQVQRIAAGRKEAWGREAKPAPHSITSSARSRSDCGIASPSARAVFRFSPT